jgi:hypothetical protein
LENKYYQLWVLQVVGSNPAAPTNKINILASIFEAKSSQNFPLGRPWEGPKNIFGVGHMEDEHSRESWARSAARHIVDGALSASERSGGPSPSPGQISLLREIARRALWHMPNSRDEVRKLTRWLDIENLRHPNPFDDDPPGG